MEAKPDVSPFVTEELVDQRRRQRLALRSIPDWVIADRSKYPALPEIEEAQRDLLEPRLRAILATYLEDQAFTGLFKTVEGNATRAFATFMGILSRGRGFIAEAEMLEDRAHGYARQLDRLPPSYPADTLQRLVALGALADLLAAHGYVDPRVKGKLSTIR